MKRFNKTVDEISGFDGFDFIVNPFEVNTHIIDFCESGGGIFVCISPEDGEKFKYQPCRRAKSTEIEYYLQCKLQAKMKEEIIFLNVTPHAVTLNDGTVFPSVGVARVSAYFGEADENGICSQSFGSIIGLPKPQNNVFLIVSALVLSAAKESGRTDCVAPATGHPDTIRNEAGHIVSVPCFVR